MPAIAIVGMACVYPDASSPRDLWENLLAKRRAFRRMPPERLRLEDYFSPDANAPDAIYATEAAVIEGYEFDRIKFRVAGTTYREVDLVHWLALDVASQALTDAGFPDGNGLPSEATGVIVGNSLTGEFSRAATLRLRWPFVRRTVDAQLRAEGWDAERRHAFQSRLEGAYKAPFAPMGEETLAGGLSNTIAGRICNQFRLQGGGYTIDGACSASLLAVANACVALEAGDLEVALAGGVDLSLDPFELIGFSRIGALARGEMRVYDRHPTGFLPGEGCGFVVLMRHEDALAQGLRCYALIRGWGISSDGGGGITRPEAGGQRLAMQRAYRRAGYGIETVEYFEGHGTGTAVGDEVELHTLAAARRSASSGVPPAVIGSVKANIGHTKAAAGIAGLIKATMALHMQVLPPNTGLITPHPDLASRRSPDSPNTSGNGRGPPSAPSGAPAGAPALRSLVGGELWRCDRPLRAGVSAFGFGGINVHVSLEGCAVARRTTLTPHEATLLSSAQDAELFLLGADDRGALLAQVEHLAALASRLSQAELADLAACLAKADLMQGARAAVVAATPMELVARLEALREWLIHGEHRRAEEASGVFLGTGEQVPRIGFLFPGQASPVRLDGGAMAWRFAQVRELYALADLSQDGDEISTAVAQPAIAGAELAALRMLASVGVQASVAVGHSLGELTALHWAGALDEAALLRLVRARGQAMNDVPGPAGGMASIGADAATVNELLDGYQGQLGIAGFNASKQTVISGREDAVTEVVARARSRGITGTALPVSHAFHSPLMAPAADVLGEFLASETFRPLRRTVISTVTGAALAPEEDARALLKRQLMEPVRFTEALAAALNGVDLCIEVGPGTVLSRLVRDCSDVPVCSVDAAGPSLAGLLTAIGAAYAFGMPIDRQAIFRDRFTRPFSLDWQPKFFTNPCELAPLPECSGATTDPEPAAIVSEGEPGPGTGSSWPHSEESQANPLELVRSLVARRAELPIEAVTESSRLLLDLHLNSITVGQLAAEASRQLNLPPPTSPTQYSDATVGELAQALQELVNTGALPEKQPEMHPAGIDVWVRAFTVELIEHPLPDARPGPTQRASRGSAMWRVFASETDPLAEPLREALASSDGPGVAVILAPDAEERQVRILLQAAHAALEMETSPLRVGSSPRRYFVLVQRGARASSFAKTLHLEAGNLTTCVIYLADDTDACRRVLAEMRAASGYHEAHYDSRGLRREPRLQLLAEVDDQTSLGQRVAEFALGPENVLLVSGGGKGIAAECAADLAQETGVRLVILGRSNPTEDNELAANLERLTAKSISFRYFSADVSDAAAVTAAVYAAQAELGPVTAILHAAGVNRPRPLHDLTDADFLNTLRPKLQGARNLLASIDPQHLRLFVAFSSIIARTGLRGEADYALANEWLSMLTAEFQSRHPHCRCIAIEWSVWSGVGMGERLGRIDALARDGISAISPDTGIAILRQLVSRPPPASAVVVTGRYGNAPTLKLECPELPFLRFLEQPRVYYPKVELVVDSELSRASDPYLEDHVFQGQRMFPAVMGLEAMAQAAMALLETHEPPAFENVEFVRPVIVPEGHGLTLRVAALARSAGRAEVALRSSETGFQVDHFRASCGFEQAREEPGPARELPLRRLALEPQRDLYGGLLFQRGRFQRLAGYWQLAATTCLAEIGGDDPNNWFAHYLASELVYGDPGLRDATIHAVQACIPHGVLLPTGIERLEPRVLHGSGPWSVSAQERWREADDFCYDLEVRNADGSLRERFRGLRLKRVADVVRKVWVPPLLAPYIERRVKELIPEADFSISLQQDAFSDRRASADRAIQEALGKDVVVLRRPDGKPEAPGERSVSASHVQGFTMAVSGPGAVACDLESIVDRSEQVWRDVLGDLFALAQLVSCEMGEPLSSAATRVWCALECLKKAGMPTNMPMVLDSFHGDGWMLFGTATTVIATYTASIEDFVRPLVTAGIVERAVRRETAQASGGSVDTFSFAFGRPKNNGFYV